MSNGGELNTIATALTVIFVVSLLLLLAEVLYYFLWRRRVFRQKPSTGAGVSGGDPLNQCSSSFSKDLFHFLCLGTNSRLGRSSIAPTSSTGDHDSKQRSDIEIVGIDVLKMKSAPRFLFTIKEEDEDLEDAAEVAVEIDDATPFCTPCASPHVYFTPTASPAREVVNAWSTGQGTKA